MSKLKVMSEIVEGKTLLSHCIMEEVHKTDWFDKMPKRRKGMSDEEIENETVELRLTLNGERISVVKFFDKVESQLERMIKEKATELVKEQTSEKLADITNKIFELNEVTDHLATSINWDIDLNSTK